MKYLYFLLLSVLLFTACENSEEAQARHDAKIVQEARAQLLKEIEVNKTREVQKKKDPLSKIGISSKDGVITIDTNRTKTFFENWGKKMQDKMKELSDEIKKGVVEEKGSGIEINTTSISIDLNKTKTFLDNWGKKMQGYVKEFETLANELNPNRKKDTNASD